MPVERVLLATDDDRALEHVRAPGHGPGWGPMHLSPNWRWILPGTGGVELRSGAEHLLVDELTAFHLRPGDAYQLQHPRTRSHMVMSTPRVPARPQPRGWLLDPRGLLALKVAARRLREGGQDGGKELATAAADALRRALPMHASAQPPALLRGRRFLASDAGRERSLEEVAEAAGTSPFELARAFRRHVGVSPHQYRLRLRLAGALQRLEEGERDLAGLAHDLGFSSQSHFGALLRREAGVTPAQARRLLGR